MTDTPNLNIVPLSADEGVLEYRANPNFNDSLDEQYGIITIGNFNFQPSEVLFRLEPDAYRASLTEYRQQQEEDFKELIVNNFPLPIAHAFYRFEHGSENYIQKLHHLRDVWESLITMLLGLVLGECCCRTVPLNATGISLSECRSESLAKRLDIIERILRWARDNGFRLDCHDIIPFDVVEKMRELNRVRNGFSHSQAISEQRAKLIIQSTQEEVLSVIHQVEALASVSVFRYVGPEDNDVLSVRVETFAGHALTRTIRTLRFTPDQLSQAAPVLNGTKIVAHVGNLMFSLAPYVCPRQDTTGHRTSVCLFKKRQGRSPNHTLRCDVVGEGTQVDLNVSDFDVELNAIGDILARKATNGGANAG